MGTALDLVVDMVFTRAHGTWRVSLFWFFCTVVVYSVGGGHLSWTHYTPFCAVNREGNAELIASCSRIQYVAKWLLLFVVRIAFAQGRAGHARVALRLVMLLARDLLRTRHPPAGTLRRVDDQ